MTSTEIAVAEPVTLAELVPERDVVDGWVSVLERYIALAAEICDTDFAPKGMRGSPATMVACWMAGRELGIGPMTALKHIAIVHGTPSMSAEYKRARVLAAGHQIEVMEHTTVKCTVRAKRRGGQWTQPLTYTINDAKTAKLIKPDGAWTTRPRRMLFARATSELMDMLFADVTMGLPTTEIVEDGDWRDGEFVAGEGGAGDMPAAVEDGAQPVQRKTRKPRATAAKATAPEASEAELEEDMSSEYGPEEGKKLTGPQAEEDALTEPEEDAGLEGEAQADGTGIAGKMSLRRIDVLLTEIGVGVVAARLRVCATILGRELKSLSGLSQDEASRVLDVLAAASKKDDKRAALKRLMRAAQEEREAAPAGEPDDDNEDGGAPF